MEEKTLEIIAEILQLDDSALQAGLDNAAIWDSLQRVEILFALEEEFEIQFSEKELAALTTPRRLCRAAAEKAGNPL